MSTITTRAGKGSPLTNTELDSNFTNLNDDKYQSGDSMVASELDLSAISSSIADTAVDVFVYDTRKDSDGGAWRKRTQHTSWYNETLNTATRGSRKEFPAVAVIVAESNQVTIYDGDDPSLPMWMVFSSTAHWVSNSALSAKNAEITVTGSAMGVRSVQMLSDVIGRYSTAGWGRWAVNIAERNTGSQTFLTIDTSVPLVNSDSNDIAMTVLPNAPIDPATQLPIPTIAVATDGGVSVIKDDGSVVDWLNSNGNIRNVHIEDGLIVADGGAGIAWRAWARDIPTSDGNDTTFTDAPAGTWLLNGFVREGNAGNSQINSVTKLNSGMAFVETAGSSTNDKLFLVDSTDTPMGYNSTAHITSTYNTGWMNGDIKLATLSDTDATDVTGSELVTNGTFDTDISGWSDVYLSNISWDAGGYLHVNNPYGTTARTGASQSLTNLTVGKAYTVSAVLVNNSGKARIALGTSYSAETATGYTGVISHTFVATSTTHSVRVDVYRPGYSCSMDVDNVSVRLAEEDRSVNGNGLQVFGTVTKNPVATGADLVAYSGFSGSNYLEQPYNSDLDFTDTVFINVWIKDMVPSVNIFDRGVRYTNHSYGLYIDGGNDIRFYYSNDGTTDKSLEIADGQLQCANGWHMISISVDSGVIRMYLDGEFKTSESTGGNFYSQATAQNGTKLGNGSVSNTVWGSMEAALFRISGTAPTAEQIAKIYEDEKVLFQEGAQATLYGSSDAVTALAYDDTTDLLHVGTSAGRSDFSGLRRVSNTTDAVGTAISASNGMIVEE